MNFFNKKETLIQNMTFMALMSAINVIFALLICFVWYLAIILVLVLPLTSLLVGLYCKKRYFPLYLICSLALCFLVTIYDPVNTIFYVFPALISGFVMAFLINLKMRAVYLVVAVSLVNLAFNYLSIPFIRFYYNQDIIAILQSLLKAENNQYFYLLVPLLLYLYSLLQSFLTYIIIKDELKKFKYEVDKSDRLIYINIIVGTIMLILQGILSVYALEWAYLVMIIGLIYFIDYLVIRFKTNPKIYIITYGVILFINVFLFLSLYQYMESSKSLLTLNGFTICIIFDYLINYQLLIRLKKDKINS